MKYVIYLRVSTDQQGSSGLGIEAQRKICMSCVPDNGHSLEFADIGYSGALGIEKRPSLLKAVTCLDKDDVFIVAKRDRIGRDPIVNAMIERAIERKKAKIVTAGRDVKDDNDPSSILMRRMVDAFSEYERLIIGARTKAALQIKKSKGQRAGHIPYGYQLSDDGIHLEPNEVEQEILKIMNAFKEEGLSLRKIAAQLNMFEKLNRVGPWNHLSVMRVMDNIEHWKPSQVM